MADASPRPRSGYLKANKDCPPDKEINILLLGQTGIGKTTFINSFANYLVNNTLEEAINDDMQILIPTSLSYTDPETFKQQLITIGDKKNHEKINENGESCTQQCRSFSFPIGDRNLRLIDTPGMGDTRGSEQDNINLFEILTYISHYECLNGICIFLKPNEERLTISFRLCIKQVLHYLHSSASENIIFIFTNARSTLYSAGSSKKILKTLLDEYQNKNHLEIPFTKDNTFLLDNEPFRYLAFHKNGIQIVDEQNESYTKSWNHTIKEYERLVSYISQRPRHVVGNDLSLNGAEQLIRKLVRPIAETLRLIQQNIQLANKCKRDLLKNQPNTSPGLFQITIQVVPLQHPKLVCFGKNCSRVVDVNNENKIVLYRNCQEISYLSGVIQETIQDPRVEQCKVIDRQTGNCIGCGCSSDKHMHNTYDYHKNITYININNNKSEKTNDQSQSLMSAVDKRIKDLQKEQANVEDIYQKLSKFLYVNAIHPVNDDILYYLQLFSQEEQMKHKVGIDNDDVITGLVEITTKYTNNMDIFKKVLSNGKDSINETDMLKTEDVFPLVGSLYRLPINGQQIREQINVLKNIEDIAVHRMEKYVKLPEKAASSNIMQKLKEIVSPNIVTAL